MSDRVYRNQWTGGRPLEERFWEKVDRRGPDDCWLWTASLSAGYGQIGLGGKDGGNGHAHRVAWELSRGPIPVGLNVLHRCDVPACCNPRHLFLGTLRDNTVDMYAKGRAAGPIAANARKTQCERGHPFDEENTYWRSGGRGRDCRTCIHIRRQAQALKPHPKRPRWISKTPCVIEGCDAPNFGHGWCSKHYSRWRRHGSPLFANTAEAIAGLLARETV